MKMQIYLSQHYQKVQVTNTDFIKVWKEEIEGKLKNHFNNYAIQHVRHLIPEIDLPVQLQFLISILRINPIDFIYNENCDNEGQGIK